MHSKTKHEVHYTRVIVVCGCGRGCDIIAIMVERTAEEIAELKAKRKFRKFVYRGVDLDQLLDYSPEQMAELMQARARRFVG